MIQLIRNFFNRPACLSNCLAIEDELECIREDYRIAVRDRSSLSEQVVLLEKEIEILQHIIKLDDNTRKERHEKGQFNRFVAKKQKKQQNNSKKASQ